MRFVGVAPLPIERFWGENSLKVIPQFFTGGMK
jgi:hypothetical protein